MNNQNLEAFKTLCKQLPFTQNEEQQNCENQIEKFILDINNIAQLQNFLLAESDIQVLLICLQSINKSFSKLTNIEKKHTILKNNEYIDQQLNHLQNLNNFFYEYYFSLDLNNLPTFIINTTANLIADNIKIFISNNKKDHANFSNLLNKIKYNDLQFMYKIFVIFQYILENISIDANKYSYFTYKKMIAIFKFDFLNEIFDAINNIFYSFFDNQLPFNDQSVEVLKVGVISYKKALSFQFSFSYSSHLQDLDSDDMSTMIFPREFGEHFSNLKILQIFQNILKQQIDEELSYQICQCLNAMVCSRESIIDSQQQQPWKKRFIDLFVDLLQYTPVKEKFLNEKIDLIRKISHFFGQKFLTQNYENKQLFEQHIITLSQQILQVSSNKIDSLVFKKLIQYILKLKSFEQQLDENSNIYKFLQFYFEYFFNNCQNQDFLKEQYKTVSEFEELIEFRFQELKDIFDIKSQLQFQLIEQIMQIFSQNFQLLNEQNFAIYANQFQHFVLFFTFTLIKFDQISNKIDDSEVEEIIGHQRICEFLQQILFLEQSLQNYMSGQNKDIIKNIILCNNYFLKYLTHQVLQNYSYNEGLQELVEKDRHYSTMITRNQQFQKPESFIYFVCNKFLNQIEYQEETIILSSLFYLKFILESLKKKLRTQNNKNTIINELCQTLIKKNNQFLIQKNLLKLRKKVYEIVAVCYLDDHCDNYIQNSLNITQTIFENLEKNTNVENIKKIFFDIQGIYQMCYQQKITLVFTKISYPKVQQLLETQGDQIVKDNDLVTILIKFYQKILEHTSSKYSLTQAHNIMFRIISDACRLVSELLTQINQVLSNMQNFDQRAEFITTNIQLIKNFLRLFQILLKCSDISFSVFHFFGNDLFINFINNIHNFIFLIEDSIIVYYIEEKKTLLSLMEESVSILSDFMIEFFTPEQIQQFFFFVSKFYSKNIYDSQNNPENVEKIKQQNESIFQIMSTILMAIYEDSQLNKYKEEIQIKNKNLVEFLYPTALELLERFLQIDLENPQTTPEVTQFSCILFQYNLVFSNMNLFQNLIKQISQKFFFQDKNQQVEAIFVDLCKGVEFNTSKQNEVNFSQNYKTFQKKLLQLFQDEQKIRKQSNTFEETID